MQRIDSFEGHKLTPEQKAVLSAANEVNFLQIQARAGTGKTFLLNLLASTLWKNCRCLYLAYNKAVVEDAKARFPPNVQCRTAHSLAARELVAWRGKRYGDGKFDPSRLGRITAGYIKEQFGINFSLNLPEFKKAGVKFDSNDVAHFALGIVETYCRSSAPEINESHIESEKLYFMEGLLALELDESVAERMGLIINEVKRIGIEIAKKIFLRMSDTEDSLTIDHNVYLKIWTTSQPKISPFFDVILLDEAQDTISCLIPVICAQQEAKIIFAGDSAQELYRWNGCSDAMRKMSGERTESISQTFRFGPVIAKLASSILSLRYDSDNFVVVGSPSIKSKIVRLNRYDAFISRTNAVLLDNLLHFVGMYPRKLVAVEGGIFDLVKLLRDAKKLQEGESLSSGELACFRSWDELELHSKSQSGASLKTLVRIVKRKKIKELIETLENCNSTNCTDSADTVFTTAHRAKGLEFDSVRLAGDFEPVDGPDASTASINLLYVAVTRCKLALDVSDCNAITKSPSLGSLAIAKN